MPAIKCSCGTWNNDSARFCRNCGSNLRQDQNFQIKKSAKSKVGAVIIVIAYYIVLIAIITGIVMAFV